MYIILESSKKDKLPQPSMWLVFKIYDYCDVLRTLYLFHLIGQNTSYSVSFLLFNATSGCIALLGFP